ncbi:MAG: lipopolysaccharide heptosyltransferase II [Methylacidiphilales bacterium]|nr:lipopolysaccharide heptosyltransferase II [Candidatus Methylacidiphilales bacterium]
MSESAFSLQGPLVIRSPNWLGDAIMAFPAVRNLKTLMGKEPLAVATPEKLAALWQLCPFVDQVIALPEPKNLRGAADKLRAGKFGAAVLLPNSLRSAAEAWLARIPQRVGYARGARGLLMSHTVPVPPRNPVRLHQRFWYIDLAAAVGAPADVSWPELKKEPAPTESAPLVAICPGAEYGPAKRWPVDRFVAVAKHLSEKRKAKIVVFGAPGDTAVADEFIKQLPEAENRTGKTSLAEFIVALASARIVVTNDSGAMHLASALGRPTVAIFGSTEHELTGPMGAQSRVVRHHVPCSPCFLRECPLDFACMTSITPERVIAETEALWT